jgi:small subunit ribosomal protein S20
MFSLTGSEYFDYITARNLNLLIQAMPITASAKKAQRQTIARTERRKPYKTQMKSSIKKFIEVAKKDVSAAEKLLPATCSCIDIASKKHIIHKKNASRKKSRLAKMLKVKETAPKKAVEKAADKEEVKA